MLDTAVTLIIPLICAALSLWGSVFHEKEDWHKVARFLVLLAASAGLALSVDKLMPTLGEGCSMEVLSQSVLQYSLALVYTGILSLMVLASFYMVVVDGLFGGPIGLLRVAGCIISGLLLAVPTFTLGFFVIKNFWWLAIAVLAVLAVIGAIVGGTSSKGVSASSQGDVFVDKFGNEYIRTSDQTRIYSGNETWNTSKEYHIKGQSGSFYRKIK